MKVGCWNIEGLNAKDDQVFRELRKYDSAFKTKNSQMQYTEKTGNHLDKHLPNIKYHACYKHNYLYQCS